MYDLAITKDGDLDIEGNDISVVNSVTQAALVRLRWIFNEWRLGPDLGLRWFEDILIKNPNVYKIRSMIRTELMKVERVQDAAVENVEYDRRRRTLKVRFKLRVAEEVFREEAVLYV